MGDYNSECVSLQNKACSIKTYMETAPGEYLQKEKGNGCDVDTISLITASKTLHATCAKSNAFVIMDI